MIQYIDKSVRRDPWLLQDAEISRRNLEGFGRESLRTAWSVFDENGSWSTDMDLLVFEVWTQEEAD